MLCQFVYELHLNTFFLSILDFTRHILATVHFNANLQRQTKVHQKTNENRITVSYPKFKNGEAVVRDIRITPNFGELNSPLKNNTDSTCRCVFVHYYTFLVM